MSVTITASANSTPPDGTVIATTQVGGKEHQLFIQVDDSGSSLGQVGASPIYVSVPTRVSASISSGTVSAIQSTPAASGNAWPVRLTDLTNNAALDSASRLTVAVTNQSGSAAGSPLFASVTNQVSASISNVASVILSSGSVVVTNQVSASISNVASVVVSSGSVVVTSGSLLVTDVLNRISASISLSLIHI